MQEHRSDGWLSDTLASLTPLERAAVAQTYGARVSSIIGAAALGVTQREFAAALAHALQVIGRAATHH